VAASVKAPRKQHGDSKPKIIWTPEELIQFRSVADEDDWAAGWRLTLCGLRRSEVMGMRWEAVDMERGEVVVQAGRVLLDGTRTATTPSPQLPTGPSRWKTCIGALWLSSAR
jgi:integrase